MVCRKAIVGRIVNVVVMLCLASIIIVIVAVVGLYARSMLALRASRLFTVRDSGHKAVRETVNAVVHSVNSVAEEFKASDQKWPFVRDLLRDSADEWFDWSERTEKLARWYARGKKVCVELVWNKKTK